MIKWLILVSVVLSLIGANLNLLLNIRDLKDELSCRDSIINILENDRICEDHDSIINSDGYLRYEVYQKSGITVPDQVPLTHLKLIKKLSDDNKIPLSILVRIINHESRFDSSVVNQTSGALSYMQIVPVTFKHFCKVLKLDGKNTVYNNLICGTELLKQNYRFWYKKRRNRNKAWEMALACYAIGDSIPRKTGKIPESVQPYIKYVMCDETF